MNTLYCIECNCRTPRNFADERVFNGVYCERCAPKILGNPPNVGSSVQKPKSLEIVIRSNGAVVKGLRAMMCRIQEEIDAALDSNYKARKELIEKGRGDEDLRHVIDGKIAALRGISDFGYELLDKMTEEVLKK